MGANHSGRQAVVQGPQGSPRVRLVPQGLPMILKGSPGRGLSCRALPEQNDQTKGRAKLRAKKKRGESKIASKNLEQKKQCKNTWFLHRNHFSLIQNC